MEDLRFSVFVASSVAGIEYARAIQSELAHDYAVTIWNQGQFLPSETTIDSLLKISLKYDFGIFIFSPDDTQVKENETVLVARDNVLFECGLFFSTIGRRSCFFMVPRNIKNFKIPSDLWGITPVVYDCVDTDYQRAVGSSCNQIRHAIRDLTRERSRGISFNGEWELEWSVENSSHYQTKKISRTIVRHIGNRFSAVCHDRAIPFEVQGEIKNGRYITGTWGQSEATYFGAFQLVAHPSGEKMSGKSVGFRSNGEVLAGNWLLKRIKSKIQES